MSHLDRHNILTDFQFGFRKKRSCETQLLITVNELAKSLDGGRQTDCILLDFSEAFDPTIIIIIPCGDKACTSSLQ